MRKARILRAAVCVSIVGIVVAGYQVWSLSGRGGYTGKPVLNIKQELSFGRDQGSGNLVAIQPWMLGADYSSGAAFSAKLDGYFAAANRKGWLKRDTVVVLPEYLGAWLLCAGEKRSVWQAKTVSEAMKTKVLSSAPAVAWQAASAPCSDRLKYAVFSSGAAKMASIYDGTLSRLARKYGVTIVGGSTILPSPSVVGGKLRAGSGALYNVAPVYGPDGRARSPLVKKVYVTADEKDFVSPGRVADLPVYSTPIGRLGVLICADAWFPDAYGTLRRKGAQVIVVPSYIIGDKALDRKWKGYSGAPPPADVDKALVGKITKYEAWQRCAFAGRCCDAGIGCGATACLRGDLWDMGSDGIVVSIREGRATTLRSADGAVLANTWIGKLK